MLKGDEATRPKRARPRSRVGEGWEGAHRKPFAGGPPRTSGPSSHGTGQAAGIALCGAELVADSSGVIYWPAEQTLLVADLHLEKGSSFARRGVMLPPYDTCETLRRLVAVIGRYAPVRVVALGDSFHDVEGADRIAGADLDALRQLQKNREWIWIAGNHDRELASRVGGQVRAALTLGGLTLRHEPAAGAATAEVAGHMHPAARVVIDGASVRRPCFIGNGQRLVMPAFGAFTGGLNVLDEAFRPLFDQQGFAVWMLGARALYPIATHRLSSD
jgi:uncharacterized protein